MTQLLHDRLYGERDMTRNGKIARLPLAIRQELNQRLRDGQQGKQLAAWLNGLPEVQALMTKQFHGKPIDASNLSRWKTGGYRNWEEDLQTMQAAAALAGQSPGLPQADKKALANRLALILTARTAVEMTRMDSTPGGEKKSQRWSDLLGRIIVLRRGEIQDERLRLDRKKIAFREEKLRRSR